MNRLFSSLVLLAIAGDAFAATNVLQLGRENGPLPSVSAGGREFTATGFTDAVVYDVGTLPYTNRSPAIPGFLAIDSGQCGSRGCARVLNIRFTVPASYAGQEMMLDYSRYGSEIDTIRLDGVSVGNIAGAESKHLQTDISLGALSEGQHIVSFQYTDFRAAQGHWIDDIRLYIP